MAWNITKHDYIVSPRNPLLTVSIELRFFPILKIAKGGVIPEFQEEIRSEYPYFRSSQARTITLDPVTKVQTSDETLYHFMKKEDQSQTEITLSGTSLLLECSGHISKDDTLNNFDMSLNALIKTCGSIKTQRLGVRYINEIDKDLISSDLNKEISWNDVVKDDFLTMPSNIADLNETIFNNEINAAMEQGALTLRYGMLRNGHNVNFRYDIDRFYFGEFDISETRKLLDGYSLDIYNLFTEMKGDALAEWMELDQ